MRDPEVLSKLLCEINRSYTIFKKVSKSKLSKREEQLEKTDKVNLWPLYAWTYVYTQKSKEKKLTLIIILICAYLFSLCPFYFTMFIFLLQYEL